MWHIYRRCWRPQIPARKLGILGFFWGMAFWLQWGCSPDSRSLRCLYTSDCSDSWLHRWSVALAPSQYSLWYRKETQFWQLIMRLCRNRLYLYKFFVMIYVSHYNRQKEFDTFDLNSHIAPCGHAALVDSAGQVDQVCVIFSQCRWAVGVFHTLCWDCTALTGVPHQQKNT